LRFHIRLCGVFLGTVPPGMSRMETMKMMTTGTRAQRMTRSQVGTVSFSVKGNLYRRVARQRSDMMEIRLEDSRDVGVVKSKGSHGGGDASEEATDDDNDNQNDPVEGIRGQETH